MIAKDATGALAEMSSSYSALALVLRIIPPGVGFQMSVKMRKPPLVSTSYRGLNKAIQLIVGDPLNEIRHLQVEPCEPAHSALTIQELSY